MTWEELEHARLQLVGLKILVDEQIQRRGSASESVERLELLNLQGRLDPLILSIPDFSEMPSYEEVPNAPDCYWLTTIETLNAKPAITSAWIVRASAASADAEEDFRSFTQGADLEALEAFDFPAFGEGPSVDRSGGSGGDDILYSTKGGGDGSDD